MDRDRKYGRSSKKDRRRRSSSSSSTSSSSSSDSNHKAHPRSRHSGGRGSSRHGAEKSNDSSRLNRRRSRSRDRKGIKSHRSGRERDRDELDRYKSKKDYRKRRSRSRSTSSSSSPHSNSQSSTSTSKYPGGSNTAQSQVSKLTLASSSSALQTKIEEKLDFGSQIQRLMAIEDVEKEGFKQKSFKSTVKPFSRLDDIPLPPLELKPITLTNLDKEILCHPSLIINQREREEQWVKKLFSLRQKLYAAGDI